MTAVVDCKPAWPLPRPSSGVALLLCLLFLASLALLGLSASTESVMQGMLTSNLQDDRRARESALGAQRWAEQWLLGLGGAAPAGCKQPCQGVVIHAAGSLPAHPEFADLSWWKANGHEAGIDPMTGERVASFAIDSIDPPMWIIEFLHGVPAGTSGYRDDQTWYRILARGSGRTPASVSVVESVVSRPWRSQTTADRTTTVSQDPCPGFNPVANCARVAWRSLR